MLLGLTIVLMLLTACSAVQALTGRELIKLTKQPRRPAQIRRDYIGPTAIGAAGVLLTTGTGTWWAIGLFWGGVLWTAAATTKARRRA